MRPPRLTAPSVLVVLTLALAVAGCGGDAPSPSAPNDPATAAPSASTTAGDLSAIACATADPEDVGELTGAWAGSEGGIYYIRQVGDCVWWFGNDIGDIEPGLTGQPGFANVASGRLAGTTLEVEYADLPVGDTLGGGGLTFIYDEANDQLTLTEQRGDWIPFGARTLTRIDPPASPVATPSASASS